MRFVGGDTLLHCAVKSNCSALVSLLTSLGSDVRAVNGAGIGILEAIILRESDERRMGEMVKGVFGVLREEERRERGPTALRYGVYVREKER